MTHLSRYILADFDIHDPLSEYHSYAGMELDYLPRVPREPVVDVLAYKISNKENVSVIFSIYSPTEIQIRHTPASHDYHAGTLRALYEQKSKYNNFLKMSKNINVIIYQPDCMLVDLKNIARKDTDFCTWINELKPTILC